MHGACYTLPTFDTSSSLPGQQQLLQAGKLSKIEMTSKSVAFGLLYYEVKFQAVRGHQNPFCSTSKCDFVSEIN